MRKEEVKRLKDIYKYMTLKKQTLLKLLKNDNFS